MQEVAQDTGEGGQGDRTLAGLERCRTDLWGSAIVRSLGCTLLPSLASGNLFVTGDELPRLSRECALILDHLAQVARATRYDEEYIRFRTANIAEAVLMAGALERGMVVIW
jgi:hypothetical protein